MTYIQTQSVKINPQLMIEGVKYINITVEGGCKCLFGWKVALTHPDEYEIIINLVRREKE